MIALTSVIIGLFGVIYLAMWMHYQTALRRHVDNVKLSEMLEAKLKSMEELKARMEALLIKQGLGR